MDASVSPKSPNDPAASVARKVRRRILPILMAAWFIAYIDRFNVSFAALQMNEALGFSAAVFGFGAGVFFLGYALFEVPSNLALSRIGPRRWLFRIMVTWGLISSAMMFVQSPATFYVLRFLLGVAEAGCFPGMAYYLSQWLSPRERAAALGLLGSMAMLSGIAGAPLAAALLSMDGLWGLSGWQWLFLIEGIPAVAIAFWMLKALPDSPERVTWLTPEERAWLEPHMAQASVHSTTGSSLFQVMRDRRYWIWSAAFLCLTAAGGSFRVFQPLILRDMADLGDTMAALFSALPAVAGLIAIVHVGRRSTRMDERCWHAVIPMLVAAIGLVLVGVTHGLAGALIVASIASIGVAAQPPIFASVTAASYGSINAVGIAFVNSAGAIGAFAGPYAVGYLIDRTGGLAVPCAVAGAVMTVAAGLALVGRERAPAVAPVPHRAEAT